jgi:hypothetical protein
MGLGQGNPFHRLAGKHRQIAGRAEVAFSNGAAVRKLNQRSYVRRDVEERDDFDDGDALIGKQSKLKVQSDHIGAVIKIGVVFPRLQKRQLL